MREHREVKDTSNLTEARKFIIDHLIPAIDDILLDYFHSKDFTESDKSRLDLVTMADEQINRYLENILGLNYPDAVMLMEETAPDSYADFAEKEKVWIIDPLDGTGNFAAGRKEFAISISLVKKGRPVLGVIHSPLTKVTCWAQEDVDNAFRRYTNENGDLVEEPLAVSCEEDMNKARLCMEWSSDPEKRKETARWMTELCTKVRYILSTGSTVENLAAVARGEAHAVVQAGLKPWDLSAGMLLVEKAGGTVTDHEGQPCDVYQPDVIVSNGKIHDAIQQVVTAGKH